jgi:hypothetical protein
MLIVILTVNFFSVQECETSVESQGASVELYH